MLTGRLPFPGKSSAEIFRSLLGDPPTPPSQLNPEIPAELERIVLEALEKDRELRIQSAAEIKASLLRLRRDTSTSQLAAPSPAAAGQSAAISRRKLWIGVAAVLAVIATVWLGKGILVPSPSDTSGHSEESSDTSAMAGDTPSIAVLPFVDMSPEGDQEYFSDGLAEELLNALAKNRGLKVAGRTSSFSFKGKDDDLRVIGAKLNVTSILEGSVRKAGDQVRITVQLINVADGFHLWSESYDRQLKDIFAVQKEIASAVAGALQVTLLGARGTAAAEVDPEAYSAYLQGKFFLERLNEGDLQRAVALIERARNLEPSYAPAWASLARVRFRQADYGDLPRTEGNAQARQAAKRAIELDPNLAEAYTALGFIKMVYDWDWEGADAAIQQALDLGPGSAKAIENAANLAATLGRFDKALALGRRAVALDPLSADAYRALGLSAFYSGRLEEAEKAFRKALELNPQRVWHHVRVGWVLLEQGRLQEALQEMEQSNFRLLRNFGLALTYHAMGRQEEANAALTELVEEGEGLLDFQIASVYAYRDEVDLAFQWLNRAYETRDAGLASALGYPYFRKLHDDPRWEAFLKKMKLDG
ncbi:MAG: tetratricopeptide repeat protein [Thermoanaerobaculia bacterium]